MLQSQLRIGIAGAGFIVRDCHLPAYKQAGLHPVAIASRNRDTAVEVAKQHEIATVHDSFESLIDDPTIEVLDIAVPPQAQPDLIRLACERGKGRLRGILAQKPLALSVAEGRELVNLCKDAGIALQVNQNMRHDQSVRALKQLLDTGALGEVVFASIDMRAVPHWMPWAKGMESLSTFIMSIHHLDTFRYWLGTPDRVSGQHSPRSTYASSKHVDGINLYILEYDTGPRAAAWDDVWAGPCKEGVAGDIGIRWRVEGTDGLAIGTIGWPGYPERVPSTIDYSHESAALNGFETALERSVVPRCVCRADVGIVGKRSKWELSLRSADGTILETLALCEAVSTRRPRNIA